ncbi:MAG: hypothetical protein K6U11_00035 [bacterium]|nr:hypothetical protein [bacterium]
MRKHIERQPRLHGSCPRRPAKVTAASHPRKQASSGKNYWDFRLFKMVDMSVRQHKKRHSSP